MGVIAVICHRLVGLHSCYVQYVREDACGCYACSCAIALNNHRVGIVPLRVDEDDVVGAFKVESWMLGIHFVEAYGTFSVIKLCYKAQVLILFFNLFAKLFEVFVQLWQLFPKVFQGCVWKGVLSR